MPNENDLEFARFAARQAARREGRELPARPKPARPIYGNPLMRAMPVPEQVHVDEGGYYAGVVPRPGGVQNYEVQIGAIRPVKKKVNWEPAQLPFVVSKDSRVYEMFPGMGYTADRLPKHHRKRIALLLDPVVDFPYQHPVGVEIEVEGFSWPKEEYVKHAAGEQSLLNPIMRCFKQTADGSLRNNGTELVTYFGVLSDDMPKHFELLDQLFTMSKAQNKKLMDFSFRCGVHVHVDVTEHTMEELYRVFLAYTVLEPLLFEISGGRTHNKFCFAVQNCVSAVGSALYYGQKKSWVEFSNLVGKGNKYMAMNLKTVRQYGTLEFRHHEGTHDHVRLTNWLLVLLDLVVGMKKVDTQALEHRITHLNTVSDYDNFLLEIAPNSHHLLRVPKFEKKMYEGVAFIKEAFASAPEDLTVIEERE